MSCTVCFINYLDVVGRLRRGGYPMEDVGYLAYDNIREEIIHFSMLVRREPTTVADILANHFQRLTID